MLDPQDADDDTEPDDGDEPRPPYWAYAWAGGTVLARYVLDHPQIVAGRRVLDLGPVRASSALPPPRLVRAR